MERWKGSEHEGRSLGWEDEALPPCACCVLLCGPGSGSDSSAPANHVRSLLTGLLGPVLTALEGGGAPMNMHFYELAGDTAAARTRPTR